MHPPFVPPPAPTLNGGLYTGEPFARGAPWGNVPVTPDSGYMMFVALRSANPPPGAEFHVPGGGLRPGNNTPLLPEAWLASGRDAATGVLCATPAAVPAASQPQQLFRGFAYL